MKAIIPVAGAGKLLRPHTYTQPKPLIPVAGKPILGHIIENLLDAGIKDQIFVVGYLKEKIQNYVQSSYKSTVNATFIEQTPRHGLAHALWVCREEIKKSKEILIVLGDTIFDQETKEVLKIKGSVLVVHEVDSPREFGIATTDSKGYVSEVKEKPEIPISNLALTGLYKIDQVPKLLESLELTLQNPLEEGEEYSLPDALMHMIQSGVKFKAHRAENWFDCGRTSTLLEANKILLQRHQSKKYPKFHNVVCIPPVFLAPNCQIENAIIGPNVAVGEFANIKYSIVKDSILGAYSTLENVTLSHSIVGNDTRLNGKSSSVNLGDNTEIDLG